ncbi:MAG: DUF3052 family protein [Nitrospiraceae bacterium]
MAGYSGTPLVKKLGLKPGQRVLVVDAPIPYDELVSPLPDGIHLLSRKTAPLDVVHLFAQSRAVLLTTLAACRPLLADTGMIWVSWPKQASKVPTDVTESVIRAAALPLGLVDVKVCAVNDVWSGLKLVVRREHRASP